MCRQSLIPKRNVETTGMGTLLVEVDLISESILPQVCGAISQLLVFCPPQLRRRHDADNYRFKLFPSSALVRET